jgi:molybdate transport system ATP-binding protein
MYSEIGDAELLLTRRWLGLAGFPGREGERFGALSYGEQRALLVARAAIKNPPLLILDEPCHGLDDAHRRRVLDFLQAIAGHGHSTLLHVTHDPSEVLPCTKKVLELSSTDASAWKIHDL